VNVSAPHRHRRHRHHHAGQDADGLGSGIAGWYFDYDKSDIRADAQAALTQDAPR